MPVNTTWLQVSGRNPRPFKTKKAASEAFRTELEHLTSEGWAKAWGSTATALCLAKGEHRIVLMLSTVDAQGYEAESGRRIRESLRTKENRPIPGRLPCNTREAIEECLRL